MVALPTVGTDIGQWGTELNAFLGVAHNADGSMRGVFELATYGAVGDNSTVDTTAVTNALAAASAAGGGVVRGEIGKVYKTAGGHTIAKGVWVTDAIFNHTGNNSCFTHDGIDSPNLWSDDDMQRGGVQRVSIWGNSGGSAVGIEVRNSQHWTVRDTLIGGNANSSRAYSAGTGILVNNSVYWNENLQLENVTIQKCLTGIGYTSASAASLGYHRYRGVSITIPASGVGMDIGVTGSAVLMYNGNLDVNFWLSGNNATAIKVRSGSTVDQSCVVDFRGESFHNTGCLSLVNAGTYLPRGAPLMFPFSDHIAGVNLAGATATDLSGRANPRLLGFGVVDESFPIECCNSNGGPTLQRLTLAWRYYFGGQVITGVALPVSTGAGSGVTYARSCLYGRTDLLLKASSADMSASFNNGTVGKVSCSFATAYVIPTDGLYGPGFLFDGNSPGMPRCAAGSGVNVAAITGQSTGRFSIMGGQASLPGTATLSSPNNGDLFAFEVY